MSDKSSQIKVEAALTEWARGNIPSREVKKIMKREGLQGDLREATAGYIEVFPISGGKGKTLSFNKGGFATKAYVNQVSTIDNRKNK